METHFPLDSLARAPGFILDGHIANRFRPPAVQFDIGSSMTSSKPSQISIVPSRAMSIRWSISGQHRSYRYKTGYRSPNTPRYRSL